MQKENSEIKIRIKKSKKEEWKRYCKEKGITLTNLIINSVEGRAWDNERKKALEFIEKQGNLFAKVENNINQQAKFINSQKFITKEQMLQFGNDLTEVIKLKQEQNLIFKKIYHFIANDSKDFKFSE